MSAFLAKITAFFTSVSLFIAYFFGFAAVGVSDDYEYTGGDRLVVADALRAGQGICFDGEYFYTSGSITALGITSIAKWDKNMRRVKTLDRAVPRELSENCGINHIGGIDTDGKYIYAPAEGKPYEHDFILLYDCKTLEYTGICYEISDESLTDGLPWCAVDAENGLLYTSRYGNAEKILIYSLDGMVPAGELLLSEPLDRIQGGSVYGGKLWISCDTPHSVDEPVYTVNISDGEVKLEMTRYNSNYDNEAEDIFVYPFDDGSTVHVLDYDKLLGMNIRHYKEKKTDTRV